MRKILYLALTGLLSASVSHAATNEVYSVNVVGFQKLSNPTGLVMRANPFDGLIIREVVGNDGLYTTGTDPALADNVLFYVATSQSYIIYYLRSHSSIGRPEWRTSTGWGTNVYINPGQGVFYRSRMATSRTNVTAGDVVMDGAVTNRIYNGLQILANPFTTARKLSDLNLKQGLYTTGTDPSLADNVMIYSPTSQNYQIYYLRSHSSIGRPEWRSSVWATNVIVQAGESFWFRSRVSNMYNWVETTPYPDL